MLKKLLKYEVGKKIVIFYQICGLLGQTYNLQFQFFYSLISFIPVKGTKTTEIDFKLTWQNI